MKTRSLRSRRAVMLTGAILTTLLASGCYETVQTSSGQRYLDKYATLGTADNSTGATTDIDRRVAEVAAVEPTLRFPARLGLARIDHGTLTEIPPAEKEAWLDLRERLGASFGEFIPLSTFVAEMVCTAQPAERDGFASNSTLRETINRIRLGAARQHLDAVLIYEVALESELNTTGWSLLDWTIIGMNAETHRAHATAHSSALLIDVRNGYPYGTAGAVARNETAAALYGSEEKLRDQRLNVTGAAVASLTPHIETMLRRLAAELPKIPAQ